MYAALDRFEDALALELVLRKHNCSSSYGGTHRGDGRPNLNGKICAIR